MLTFRRLVLAIGLTSALVVGALATLLATLLAAAWAWPLYPVTKLRPGESTGLMVVDRNGALLRELPLRGGGRQTWVTLDRMRGTVVSAAVASEDHRFFQHRGVDPWGVVRAVWLALKSGRAVSGASTITMQLVRLVEPHPRTLAWKVREALTAARLERILTKEQILEQYLNRAYYGNGAFGIEAAAQRYFGKPASALSLGEATFLSVLPRAPRGYDPHHYLGRALERRRHVVGLLAERGMITAEERRRAVTEPLQLRDEAATWEAPHFVDWVLAELPAATRARGGVLRTSLDLGLQHRLERAVRAHLDERGDAGLRQAGVVAVDPRTGEVLAMVGSRDYHDPAGGQVNITTTPRHPGSALKPFVYALALERGDTAATIAYDVVDVPSDYVLDRPVKEHGPARYRESLAGSYNLAAVHVLERVGVAPTLERLRAAGLGPLAGTASDYGLSLALGSGKVTLVDLAAAYGFLVNGGTVVAPTGLAGAAVRPRALFDAEVSWLAMDMLADPSARRSVFGAELPLDLPFRVAAKTGTSSGFSDTVAVGATREVVVAAWAGDFEGKGTRGTLAMWSAAPLVRAGLLAVNDRVPLTLPARPEGIVARPVCALSGMAPGSACPVKHEHFRRGTAPTAPCTWHRRSGDDVRVVYPPELTKWARRAG
ncbi:MAG: transglycosylase domain-containing protein [Deltaproteobacteria bacterium]|nr:transglycosylase domain-containing protein [Deltaproteobacteria bacterium]